MKLLLGKKDSYCSLVSIKGRKYMITIRPYEPAEHFIAKTKKALQKQGFDKN